MATGILRIQAFAARQSSPVEGVTVTVTGDGFTATRLTDAEGNARTHKRADAGDRAVHGRHRHGDPE